jgi:hypothetical protein
LIKKRYIDIFRDYNELKKLEKKRIDYKRKILEENIKKNSVEKIERYFYNIKY